MIPVECTSPSSVNGPRLEPAEPCILVILGASGDLTHRLLLPTLYNLACDGYLPERFAIVGVARRPLDTERFREQLSESMHSFNTRPTFDEKVWAGLRSRIHYFLGSLDEPESFRRLKTELDALDSATQTEGNVLFYLATSPTLFGPVAERIAQAGMARRPRGWTRLIVEKPFGHDLQSAHELNRSLLANWAENQIYRIDHYLGKETVQNLLAFRFANAVFEPLWNKRHIDHIQITATETVGVEDRGGYYDGAGVIRDMIQNHLLQVLTYVTMEPPASFRAEDIRNAKARVLENVRIYRSDEVARNCVRGQYSPGKKPDGSAAAGYRQEPRVAVDSNTETYAALRLFIDNECWRDVPIYIRSGKRLWKRGTEVVVQFKKPAQEIFRGTPAEGHVSANRLVFQVQPDQGIEFRFHAKTPGPAMSLQRVNMRFDYREAFDATRGTGYEVLLQNALVGNMTLFSRNDLVEASWRIVQPILDVWAANREPDFPNYCAGSWGPKAASDFLERDGRHWIEIVNRESLARVPLFQGFSPAFLNRIAMTLEPDQYSAGEWIVRLGETGEEMFILSRGQVEVTDAQGNQLQRLEEGNYFGELSLLCAQPRIANVRALTPCDVFVLRKPDFDKLLADHPELARQLHEAAETRYRT